MTNQRKQQMTGEQSLLLDSDGSNLFMDHPDSCQSAEQFVRERVEKCTTPFVSPRLRDAGYHTAILRRDKPSPH